MLAPSGGGLILYQAYGNLYAMTGRKSHLLEDKQIPSVGAFGRNTRDLGSFGEEADKTTNLHQHLSRISTQKLETASHITRDAVTTRGGNSGQVGFRVGSEIATPSHNLSQDGVSRSPYGVRLYDPAHYLEYSIHDGVFSIWKAFGGNTRDLGSFGEETDKITNQHQDSSRFKVLEPGDGVTIYTRRRHTSSSDGVTTSLDGVSPHRLNSDLEDSTL
ncbi:hypothetical protein Tco_0490833 [Tanacetum coccineum]